MTRSYRIYLLFLAAFVCSYVNLYAQRQEPMLDSVLKGRDEKLFVGAEAYVEDEIFYDSEWSALIRNTNKVTNVVSLRMDEYHTVALPDSFSLTALVRVIYTDKNNAEDSVEKSLTISYNKKRPYESRAYFYFYNAHKVNVKVLQLTPQHASLAAFIEAVDLGNEMLFDRDFILNCSNHSIQELTFDDTNIELTGELQVSWPPVSVAEEYDLEWTYIDKSALASGRYNTGGQLNPDLLFKYNATRVTIGTEGYNIPLLYDGDGMLYIRVRAAQTLLDGQRVTTPWSSDFVSQGGLGDYDFDGHERKLNWQSSTSFAEDGKRKTIVQYFDGSLKGRQTVTKDNTTDTTVIAETFYDRQGRPVIQVLPSPSLSSIIEFTPRFNVGLNSMDYDKGLYDTLTSASDYCASGSPAMDTVSGASYYYSSHNHNAANGIHQYIPNGYGFVFTETRYTQDNTGRINAQSGVGPDFRLGGGRETKYYYGGADQEDLDALFGTEAGDASHYQKNMVRDANGQYSVSYVDMYGRTVATALAGDDTNTPSLSKLASYTHTTQTTSLLTSTNNIQKGTTLEAVKGLLVTSAGTHEFVYQLNPQSLELDNCDEATICYDCLYDLEITITDDCSNQNMPGDTAYKKVIRNFTLGSPDTTCAPAQPLSVTFSLFLEEGSYTITKKLTINEEAMQHYRDSVYLAQNTCKTYEDIVSEQTSIIKAQLGDCTPYFNDIHDYQMYRQQMLRDMMPVSGQYADTAKGKLISIFRYPPDENHAYRNLSGFKSADGQPAIVNINGVARPPQWLSKQDFIDNFDESWAETLLPLHPEYKLLLEYEKLSGSHIWSEDYEQTDTYAAAMAKGFLNPAGNTTQAPASGFDVIEPDPLFGILNALYGSTIANNARTSINNSLQIYVQQEEVSLTAWGMATVFSKCPDNGEVIDATCRATWAANANVFSDELCEGELDMAWRFFRGAYLDIRQQWIDDFIRQRVGDALLTKGYTPVFLKKTRLLAEAGFADLASISPETARGRGTDSLNALVQTSCLEYAQRWIQQLGTCNYENAELDIIIPRLVEVCKQGGDAQHPFGASTVKPSSSYQYRSFEDVIRDYNEEHDITYDASCNAYLIDLPKPYDQPVALINKPVYSKPDSCDCDRIGTVYTQYVLDSSSYSSFSDYMQKRQGTAISDSALNTLLDLCNNIITCKFISQPVILPPALQCGTGDVCVDCNEVRNLYDSFAVQFPGNVPTREELSQEQRDKNRLFVQYMNWHLGFDKTVSEYLEFIENCTMPASDSLLDIVKDFRSIYKDVTSGQVYKNYKITPAAHALVDAANALLQARHSGGSILPPGYLLIPRTSDYSAKLMGIAPNSTANFHAIVPLPLDYTYSYDELESNTVMAEDFVTGIASTEQLASKYYAIVMREQGTGFRGIWNKEGSNSYNYYGVSRPTRKYLPDSTSVASNDSYIMRFVDLPDSLRTPSLYASFLVDTSLNYVFNHSDVKAIKDLRLAPEVLPFPGVTQPQFLRSSYGLKVTLEMVDGSEKEGWIRTNYNGTPYVTYKELVDSSLYDPDCEKAFTYYFNQRSGTSYTQAQVDSIYVEATGELPKACVTDCTTLESDLTEYYQQYIQPQTGYVDLRMRTFAGNITAAEGPKGVFDVAGNLVGNTIDTTYDAVNESYAQVWNSSPVNAAVGTLQYLQGGLFRLQLNPGQKAPAQGIIGQRYYQFEYQNSAIEYYFYSGFGSYIDFGDSTRAYVNDMPDTDSTRITRAFWGCCSNATDAAKFDRAYRYYFARRVYNSPAPRTVTVYHTDLNGAVGFDRNNGLTGNVFQNIRGYFPQDMPILNIHATTDSTMHDFSKVKNFNLISSIESLNMLSHGRNDCVSNIWFPSFGNNHNMKLLWLEMIRTTPGAGKKPVHDWLPDMHINFPKLQGILIVPYDSATSHSLNFSIPTLGWVSVHSGVGGNTITVDQVDQIINQVADNSLVDNGALTIQTGSTGVVRSAASDAAVSNLTARGWKLTGAGMSNAGSNVANPGYSQPNVNDSVPITNSFTEFYNEQNGTNYTFPQLQHLYDSLCGKVLNFDSIAPPLPPAGDLLCGKTEPGSPEITLFQPDACSDSTQLIAITATEIYRAYKDSLLHHFTEAYIQKCLEAGALESFTVSRPVSEYHYTLYYYDQVGNLVKTIPPEGVHPNRNTEWLTQVKAKRLAGEEQTPAHTLPTTYRYNSLNQVVSQQSPDGGLSEFWYDRLGRLAVSRNAKQVSDDWYSYTRYDHLGRITEVGEKQQTTTMTNIISRNETDLANWLNTNYTEGGNSYRARQVTQTVYDILSPVITPGFELYPRFYQKSHTLRNRVSFTRHYDKLPVSGGNVQYGEYTSASHYSYDIHGNVDTLLQDYRNGLMAAHGSYSESANNRFKLLAYHYDLISGKVNQVHYQPNEQDALYHRYEYDEENRLTDVYTTTVKDFVGFPSLEEKEAFYQYYKHGPLARTVLGQQQVQGIDYAYTLQGWLKGVNSTSLQPQYDMGNDAQEESVNGLVAKDVYGFQLNYFTGLHGDYTAINRDKNPFPRHAAFMPANEERQLYNGNISSMVVNIPRIGGPQLYNYKYDQLNRIVAMDLYRGLDVVNNTWNNDNQELVALQDYKERISYDANGNILTYLRNGTTKGGKPLAMDELTYGYNKDGNNNLINNRLRHVKDAIGNENYEEDIDNQPDDNYDYDAIGNLIKDVKEGIDNITWTVYGKISSIEKADGTVINYTYDAAGNRISKTLIPTSGGGGAETTWYVRDASGNVMALYTHKGSTLGAEGLKLAEHHIYGSSRLGIWNRDIDMDNAPTNSSNESLVGTTWLANFSRGKKFFELSNHLGNVLITVSDRKTMLEWDEDMANGDCVPGSAIDILDVDTRGEETSYIGRTEVNLLPGFESGSNDEFVAYTDDALDVCVPQGSGGSTEPFYAAEVVSASDYYPFGMVMPGRQYVAGNQYRYGFNGKENDNEVKGEGNQQDYGMRIYDPRLGRFLSVDPLSSSFPWNSPYSYAEGDPVNFIDLDGLEKPSKQAQAVAGAGASTVIKTTTNATIEKSTEIAVNQAGKLVVKKSSSSWVGGLLSKGAGLFVGFLLSPLEAGHSCPCGAGHDLSFQCPKSYDYKKPEIYTQPKPELQPIDPRAVAPPKKDGEDGAHLYKTLDNQKNTGIGGLGIVANKMDDPIPYVGITTTKIIGGNSRYSSLSIRGANSEIIATDKLSTIQGAESAIIALNTYGVGFRSHLGNLKDSDVRASTRIANLTITHKQIQKIQAGIRMLDRVRPGWDQASGSTSLLFPENNKGTSNQNP